VSAGEHTCPAVTRNLEGSFTARFLMNQSITPAGARGALLLSADAGRLGYRRQFGTPELPGLSLSRAERFCCCKRPSNIRFTARSDLRRWWTKEKSRCGGAISISRICAIAIRWADAARREHFRWSGCCFVWRPGKALTQPPPWMARFWAPPRARACTDNARFSFAQRCFPARTPIDLTRRRDSQYGISPRAAAKEHWLFRASRCSQLQPVPSQRKPTFSPLRPPHRKIGVQISQYWNPPFRRPYDKCYRHHLRISSRMPDKSVLERYYVAWWIGLGEEKFRGTARIACAEPISTGPLWLRLEIRRARATRRRGPRGSRMVADIGRQRVLTAPTTVAA